MGNATSCAPSIISNNGATKVLSSNGKMEFYVRQVKAAELMLENAGTFVCAADSLRVGQRIQGLSADQELEKRRLYLLLPMELLYSVLTNEEMISFSSLRTSNNNNHNNGKSSHNNSLANFGKNIFPSLGEFCLFPPNDSNNKDNSSESKNSESRSDIAESQGRVERLYSKQRSWRPALETIVESPSCRSH